MVRFWDTSAIVPLLIEQARSEDARSYHARDGNMIVWWGTSVQCMSAIARVSRDGGIAGSVFDGARERLTVHRARWVEIQPSHRLRQQAERVVRLHPLRAADALQLAAALEWAGSPTQHAFVTFDARLRDAANREGFDTP